MRKYVNDSFVNSEYYWDRFTAIVMGQYLTQIEQSFIQESLLCFIWLSRQLFLMLEEGLEDLQFRSTEMDTG